MSPSPSSSVPPIRLRGEGLTPEDVVAVARHSAAIDSLDPDVVERMAQSRAWVREAVDGGTEVIYGVNTGFGSLANRRIEPNETRLLSRNVILKCAVGVGPPLPEEWVRAMMLVRANSLVKGLSGIRPRVVEALIEMLNRGVTPRVPSKGSLGASGDLAPLAHVALVLTRGPEEMAQDQSGEAWFEGELVPGDEAMARAGIPRHPVEAKEGLALTNGTAMMVSALALGVHDAERLLWHAELATALSMEGLRALSEAFHPALHEANGQPGQVRTAARLRALCEESRLLGSDPDKVQDAYSVRCAPQVLGPMHDVLGFLRGRVQDALNAASDNPLIVVRRSDAANRKAISGGNFHGAGPALWLDTLGIALAETANIADRRIFRMLTPELSGGLPAMLAEDPGLHGGFMSAQYTAAALVSDNKTLAHPDSVDSIPTSANQEDHVSMGANAARRALEILDNVRKVVAIELLSAAQAIHLREDGPAALGRGTAPAYAAIRERVDPVAVDRSLAPDVAVVDQMIGSGVLMEAVEEALGGPLP